MSAHILFDLCYSLLLHVCHRRFAVLVVNEHIASTMRRITSSRFSQGYLKKVSGTSCSSNFSQGFGEGFWHKLI